MDLLPSLDDSGALGEFRKIDGAPRTLILGAIFGERHLRHLLEGFTAH